MQPETTAQAVKEKFPVGMIFVCCYIGYSILTRLVMPQIPVTLIGPFVFGEVPTLAYKTLGLLILAVCLYAILRRKPWGWHLNLGWFAYGILFALVNFILGYVHKEELVHVYQEYVSDQVHDEFTAMLALLLGVLFALVVNSVICWYLYDKKSFFSKGQ